MLSSNAQPGARRSTLPRRAQATEPVRARCPQATESQSVHTRSFAGGKPLRRLRSRLLLPTLTAAIGKHVPSGYRGDNAACDGPPRDGPRWKRITGRERSAIGIACRDRRLMPHSLCRTRLRRGIRFSVRSPLYSPLYGRGSDLFLAGPDLLISAGVLSLARETPATSLHSTCSSAPLNHPREPSPRLKRVREELIFVLDPGVLHHHFHAHTLVV